MNKKIIKYIFVILLVVTLLFIWILFKKNNNTNIDNSVIKTNSVLKNENSGNTSNNTDSSKNTSILKVGDSGTFIFNGLVKNIEIPKQIKVVVGEKVKVNDEIIEKIIDYFGFEDNENSLKEDNFVKYEKNNYSELITIGKENNVVDYSREIEVSSLIKENPFIEEETLKNKTKEIFNNLFNLNKLDLNFEEINYGEISEYQITPSDKEKGNIVLMKGTYIINNYPIYNQDGNTFTISFTRDGNLAKLSFSWPDKIQTTEIYRQIKNLDEISKIPKENFSVISVKGNYGGDEDLAFTENIENNFSIISGHFGFVTLPNVDELVPSIILEGKSVFNGQDFFITIAAPIFK